MQISIVTGTYNRLPLLKRMVASARESAIDLVYEIVVVDGGSSDGTLDRVPGDAKRIRAPRGRATQMNAGARVSHGELLVFCHADSQLPAGWREAVIEALSQPGVSGGAFQTLILPARGNLMHIRNRMRFPATWWRMYGDQAQFMTRATFERVGGFPEIPLMEDVEMSRALHQEGRLLKINDPRVVTSSRRFLERGFLRQSLLNLWSVFRYLCLGATPEEIARVYRSSREEAV